MHQNDKTFLRASFSFEKIWKSVFLEQNYTKVKLMVKISFDRMLRVFYLKSSIILWGQENLKEKTANISK
ncbi:hypothetical protein A2533_02465 [Candidatus Falkowbacteria bacterium RIFOXYD2_FULL_35_9]|nr:MAG: hypothetical protein A2300_02025 [Candidatus Falkowbacteria bacterium RIFOXYB2_FULL_35_7]OGF46840.1 MAG: hypothetical protein A2533_02465 [Candidatus Falkowbacteria bacterium RIFOXYD2_FULL_35_9]